MFDRIVGFIKSRFPDKDFIGLHEPMFIGNEKKYLNEAIDSTYVSSVGEFVNLFERNFADYVGSKYAVAIVNGTSALHLALKVAGVKPNDLVICQSFSFVATANAISYCGAEPCFVDISTETLSLCPIKLKKFLIEKCEVVDNRCIHIESRREISACVPMHTFGHGGKMIELAELCNQFSIVLIEDAAESLGTLIGNKHSGTFGKMGVFSFNGNKIVTSGGGGAIVTDDQDLANKLKYLSTQAKEPHKWDFFHTEIGYNYRLPNINAALLVAQLEQLPYFLESKRKLAAEYKDFFQDDKLPVFFCEPANTRSNYWLNALLMNSLEDRDAFLEFSNANGVMTRPVWKLMTELPMYSDCIHDDQINSQFISERLVNIPSSAREL